MKRFALILGLLLATAAGAVAQTPLDRAKAALPADAARGLEQAVANARTRGLPADALVDKALEGVAKHAPANLILDAVRRRLEQLGRADAALRSYGPPRANDVVSAADALQRGVGEDVVKRVRSGAHEGEPVGLAIHVLADLMDRGVPVDVGFEMLSSWRAHGADADELRQMPAAVDRLMRDGESPGAAGRAVAATVGRAKGVTPPGLLKKANPKANSGNGRVGPPVPPGAGPPAGKGKKTRS